MLYRLLRYLRAFIKALQLTLKGQALQPAEQRYPVLVQWVVEGRILAGKTLSSADANGFDQAQRKRIRLKLDGRDMSMETILTAVEHNMTMEYPMLLETHLEHNLTTLYALNLNDRYRVRQLAESDDIDDATVREAITALADHLDAIPPSNEVS